MNQKLQDSEDKLLELDAKLEAADMFLQYRKYKMSGYVGMLIPKPIRVLINEYPDCKSKYTSDDYKRIRNEEFNKLKTNFDEQQH